MAAFFIYSLKAGACLAWFYLFHKLLLSRDTLHTLNRFILLAAILLSLVLPLIHLTVSDASLITKGAATIEGMIVTAVTPVEEPQTQTLAQWLFVIYIIGVAFFLLRGAISIISLFRLMRKAKKVEDNAYGCIYTLPGDVSPFSWFHFVVLSEDDWTKHPREILLHERAHIERRHSADVLLCNMLIVFQWWNPAAWLIKRELQAIHEYEADRAVLAAGVDIRHYQMLLIRKAVGETLFSMANNLNHNSLKKRIKMMKQEKTHQWAALKAAIFLPLAALALTAFASEKVETIEKTVAAETQTVVNKVEKRMTSAIASPQIEKSAVSEQTERAIEVTERSVPETPKATETEIEPADTTVYTTVEVMPQFPGDIMTWIIENVKCPKDASENGMVIVKFVIDHEGNVKNPQIVRSVSTALDAEALRVVSNMPKGHQEQTVVSPSTSVIPFLLDSLTNRFARDRDVQARTAPAPYFC